MISNTNISSAQEVSLESFFSTFRKNIIGYGQTFSTPYGEKPLVYTDWTASGRLYGPIESRISQLLGPFVANVHTKTSVTGCMMTSAYHKAKDIIKKHVRANEDDVLISSNAGMTGVVNKFQRILGLKVHEKYYEMVHFHPNERPIVFCTHMEHHSNQTSWLETLADVEIIQADKNGRVDLDHFACLLEQYKDRKTKFAAVTSCSNVTGLLTPYHEIARMIHRSGGKCFVDFAASAPYIDIVMRTEDPETQLDAIYFSPHKFLGGPGSSGILVFCPTLYSNRIPDNPGGGTVEWTNPWGEHQYLEEIEAREDGGTPAFLQTIKVSYCCLLKEQMGTDNILRREHEQLDILWPYLDETPGLHILADHQRNRLGIISFYLQGIHYNLVVKLLNDLYGIQTRGGCSCAGTYGHYLLEVSYEKSKEITSLIASGNLSAKPGWIRMSIHPTLTDEELHYFGKAIQDIALHYHKYEKDYVYDPKTNEFFHKNEKDLNTKIGDWFLPL